MPSESKEKNIDELYLKQKKLNSILIPVVIVLSVTTVAGLGWGIASSIKGPQGMPNSDNTQFGSSNQQGQGPMGGGPGMMRRNFSDYFNSDSSVNTDKVKEEVERMQNFSRGGSSMLDHLENEINDSANDGDITEAQAKALIAAFESAMESN